MDSIGVNGNIYTFEQLIEIYNLKGTFLDYQRLIKKIPRAWKKKLMNTQLSVKISKSMYKLTAISSLLLHLL